MLVVAFVAIGFNLSSKLRDFQTLNFVELDFSRERELWYCLYRLLIIFMLISKTVSIAVSIVNVIHKDTLCIDLSNINDTFDIILFVFTIYQCTTSLWLFASTCFGLAACSTAIDFYRKFPCQKMKFSLTKQQKTQKILLTRLIKVFFQNIYKFVCRLIRKTNMCLFRSHSIEILTVYLHINSSVRWKRLKVYSKRPSTLMQSICPSSRTRYLF